MPTQASASFFLSPAGGPGAARPISQPGGPRVQPASLRADQADQGPVATGRVGRLQQVSSFAPISTAPVLTLECARSLYSTRAIAARRPTLCDAPELRLTTKRSRASAATAQARPGVADAANLSRGRKAPRAPCRQWPGPDARARPVLPRRSRA